MLWELIRNWNMQNRWESHWIPFEIEDFQSSRKNYLNAVSIEISWDGAEGILAGKVFFIVSNNQNTYKILKEIQIETASNLNNSYFLNIFYPSFQYFKIEYEPNGITNGRLTTAVLFK